MADSSNKPPPLKRHRKSSTPTIKQEDTESSRKRRVPRLEGRGSGRGRCRGASWGAGCGRGRGRSRTGGHGEDGTFALLSSNPVVPIDRDSDSDFLDGDKDEDEVTSGRPFVRPPPKLGSFQLERDLTIEQWYADPYERINPCGPSYDEWRRQNIHNALMKQGWARTKADMLTNWLISCNGRYQPFNPKQGGRRMKKTDVARPEEVVAARDDATPTLSPEIDTEDEEQLMQELAARNIGVLPFVAASHVSSNRTPATPKSKSTPKKPASRAPGARPSRQRSTTGSTASLSRIALENAARSSIAACSTRESTSERTPKPEAPDIPIDEQIAKIKRSLNLFNIVYVDTKLEPNEDTWDMSYVSRITKVPRPMPKIPLRTQGHLPLQKITLQPNDPALTNHITDAAKLEDLQSSPKNRIVETEDPTFGLTAYPPSQTETPEGYEEYKLKQAKKREKQETQLREEEGHEDELARLEATRVANVPAFEPNHIPWGDWACMTPDQRRDHSEAESERYTEWRETYHEDYKKMLDQPAHAWEIDNPRLIHGHSRRIAFAFSEREIARKGILGAGGKQAERQREEDADDIGLLGAKEKRSRAQAKFGRTEEQNRERSYELKIAGWQHGIQATVRR